MEAAKSGYGTAQLQGQHATGQKQQACQGKERKWERGRESESERERERARERENKKYVNNMSHVGKKDKTKGQ